MESAVVNDLLRMEHSGQAEGKLCLDPDPQWLKTTLKAEVIAILQSKRDEQNTVGSEKMTPTMEIRRVAGRIWTHFQTAVLQIGLILNIG
jgi:hypothetical protein